MVNIPSIIIRSNNVREIYVGKSAISGEIMGETTYINISERIHQNIENMGAINRL